MDVYGLKIVFSFFFAFLITFYLVPYFCILAFSFKCIDVPDGVLKKHDKATPYLGGLAVYSGFLCGIAFTIPFESNVLLFIVGTMLLLLTGLIDDLLRLRASQKFFAQCLVALCFLKAGFYLKSHFFYNIWNLGFSLLWILTVINSFNLVDVMDGLATSLAMCATVNFIIVGLYIPNSVGLLLLSSFLGSLCAFYWYNKPPAQVYLGDAGSLFIGGFLGTIPFLFDWGTYNSIGYLTPIIILGIPLLECVSLILIRIYKNIPFHQGSPDHFSCYLVQNGWSKYSILGYIFSLNIFLGAVSYAFALGLLSFCATIFLGLIFLIVWTVVLCCI